MTIVYQNSLENFYEDATKIPDILAGMDGSHTGKTINRKTSQYRAWSNSLQFMENMLRRSKAPKSCGVLIEYNLPSTSRRVDFIVTGYDQKEGKPSFVVIELKQWSEAKVVPEKPGIVIANVAGSREEETTHPCYQAWSYKMFLETMLDSVEKHRLQAYACAYMHNYVYQGDEADPLAAEPNRKLVKGTPLFGRDDQGKLGNFVKKFVGRGDGDNILHWLATGKVVPSKGLIGTVADMFDQTKERYFTLIDKQKNAYEDIMSTVRKATSEGVHSHKKYCVIVTGGPGTGKSVVAMSAFVNILRENKDKTSDTYRNVRFVSPTASFREAMTSMLGNAKVTLKDENGQEKREQVKALFLSSMNFFEPDPVDPLKNAKQSNLFHCLICDEAHRLHSRQNMYRGKNQIEDILHCARVSVFFVDDNQALRHDDIGSVKSIKEAAEKFGATVVGPVDLDAQFRCQGSDGFINWLAVVLGLAKADTVGNALGWDKEAFDFDIVDTPEEVKAFVDEKNKLAEENAAVAGRSVISGARLLAGYAWPWAKDENPEPEIDLGSIKFRWNKRSDGSKWAVKDDTRGEVGCVHTSQGLEFEWVGVFIGNDLHYDPVKKELYADIDNYHDKVGKNGLGKTKAERAKNLLPYVCRCYRVLLSRGVHGARVYCCDKNLAAYLKEKLAESQNLSAETL